MDDVSLRAAGSRLGTGTLIVLDEQTCPVGMLRNLEHFYAQESCGWCTPCWQGLHWVEELLAPSSRDTAPEKTSNSSIGT